jgi:hypothetical protein
MQKIPNVRPREENGPSIRGWDYRNESNQREQKGSIATKATGVTRGSIRENPIFPYTEIFGKSRGAQ